MLQNHSNKPNPFDELVELERAGAQGKTHGKQTSLDTLDAFSASGITPPPDPNPLPSMPVPLILPAAAAHAKRRYSAASIPPPVFAMPHPNAVVGSMHQPHHSWGAIPHMQPVAPKRSSLSMDATNDMFAIFEAKPAVGTVPPLPQRQQPGAGAVDDGWDVAVAQAFDASPTKGRDRSKSYNDVLMSPSSLRAKTAVPTSVTLASVPESESTAVSTPQKLTRPADDVGTLPQQRARAATEGAATVNLLTVVEGNLMARVTRMALLSKDWKQSYWIIEGNVLKIFKSKDDYQKNPHGSAAIRKIPITSALRISDIKFKDYKGILHCFRVEDDADRSSSVAKFASANRAEVLALHSEMERRIEFMRLQDRSVSQRSSSPTPGLRLEMLQSPSAIRHTDGVDFTQSWGASK